ncbi:hypothetical protein Tco_0655274 [Tanacetum coccineum]|uniref:Uncharacterized protein n=1 Tax=Tanacetum coccineum TaxID=301880 RepID=A0ABQ4X6I7_9ASTR
MGKICSSLGSSVDSDLEEKAKGVLTHPNQVPNSKHRSKDEAPEVIRTFLKRITVLLQSPVIIIRTDNAQNIKNQILKEYIEIVLASSHQAVFCQNTSTNGVVETKKLNVS